jgi:hypothetical protein
MPTIRCRMTDCVNWEEGYCSASRINIDDEGLCLTYSSYHEAVDEGIEDVTDWEDDVEEEEEEEEDLLAMDDDFDDASVIRGRRRWNDW